MSKGQIVNANTELIPEAPNRQAVILIVEVSVSNANDVVQGAIPSIECNELCRTPPVTVVANVDVISIVVEVTVLSEIKNGESVNIDQISARVTSRVEKSNFYRDLEQVKEWEDSTINISKNSISPRKL